MILFVLASLVILLPFTLLWKSSYWYRYGVKGPIGYPLFGNMLDFALNRTHYGQIYEDIYNKYPDLSWIGIQGIFNEPAVLVRSQELIKEILIGSFNNFQDNVLWIDRQRDSMIWHNPFVAKGEKWRQMRTELVPVFTPIKVKASFPHIAAKCKELTTYVSNKLNIDCFEAKELFSRFTIDVVASAAYGLNAECFTNDDSTLLQITKDVFLPNPFSLLETIALLFSPTLGNLINFKYVPTELQNYLNDIIRRLLEQRLSTKSPQNIIGIKSSDFVQWLIENKHRVNETVQPDVIVGHCSTFLVEGFETSSSLMAFALYEYACNPAEQHKIHQEIDNVVLKYNGNLCYEALNELPLLEASLYETLRLHPAMAALLKHCTKPFRLPAQCAKGATFQVPNNMVFVIPVKAVHYNSQLYPEPLKFKPERFLQHSTTASTKQSCSFLGFGEGPRSCPGARFALCQIKAGLVALLTHYTVQLPKRSTHPPLKISNTTFLTSAKNGIWLSLKSREIKS